jgi:hypothetical protein
MSEFLTSCTDANKIDMGVRHVKETVTFTATTTDEYGNEIQEPIGSAVRVNAVGTVNYVGVDRDTAYAYANDHRTDANVEDIYAERDGNAGHYRVVVVTLVRGDYV